MKNFNIVLLACILIAASGSVPALADSEKCGHNGEHKKDIVDTAVSAGSFKTLAAALDATGLIETLKGKGPFTVFAPTDKAFGKLPEGTVEELLKPENKAKLAEILTYHVVPGKVLAADVVKLSEATTVQGSKVQITVKGNNVKVDNAKVIQTDITCANGVIHVINRVILPPEKTDSRAEAQELIRNAVYRGSHLYNSGNAEACANLYRSTAQKLMMMSPSPLSESSIEHLQRAMERSQSMDCANSQAWAMRHALDRSYASLKH